jgi:hypothetical protein
MTLTELLGAAYWKANFCIIYRNEPIGLKSNGEWHIADDWDHFKDMDVSSFREAEGCINVQLKAASRLS